MKNRNIIYISIAAVCVVAIVVGVYYQIFGDKKINTNTVEDPKNVNEDSNGVVDPEVLIEEFNGLFDNSFDDQGYDTSSIKKITGLEEQDVIYAAYNIAEEKLDKYNININLPVFNVEGEVASEFNSITQSIFADKTNEVLSGCELYTVFDVEYASYLNENILSVVIKSNLKEGKNPQRTIVQTYNYDIETGKKVTLNDVLNTKEISQKEVNKKIEKQVEEANKRAEAVAQAVSQTGQKVYKRDINNAMYVTDNANYFFIGENGQIYIVYPYGNSNFTSELDIIKI